MELRQYQLHCIQAIQAGWSEYGRQLAVLPTGGGKTIIFSALASQTPGRTLILAHREELVNQAIQKLYKSTGILAGKEKSEHKASLSSKVVVASIQTMQRRLGKWPCDHFSLIVTDEAHHCIAESWQKVLRHFDSHAKVLGVTATPDRGDKKNLGKYFENIAYEISLFDLINQGYLSRISVKSVPLKIDISGVEQTAGDYDVNGLGDALAPYLRSIAESIKELCPFRKVLVFLPLIATSQAFTDVCQSIGLNACHISGESPDREEILQRYARGEIDILCNAMLLSEGYDEPSVDCIIVLRPTKSRPLFAQMVGRGTRIDAYKTDLLLLDFLWLHAKHNLIRPAHLVATSQEQAEEMTALAAVKAGGEMVQDSLDLEGLASEVQVAREKKLSEELAAKAKRQARTMDAMEFCLSLHAPDLVDYEPATQWEMKPVTANQKVMLEKNGFDLDCLKCAGQASKVIDLIMTRAKMNLATPKQLKYLRQFQHPNPETCSMEAATDFLSKRFSKPAARKAA